MKKMVVVLDGLAKYKKNEVVLDRSRKTNGGDNVPYK